MFVGFGDEFCGIVYCSEIGVDVDCVGDEQQCDDDEDDLVWQEFVYVVCKVLFCDLVDLCVDELDCVYQWVGQNYCLQQVKFELGVCL